MEGQRSIDDNSKEWAQAQAQSQVESNNMTQSSPMRNNQGPSISPIEEEQTQIDDSNVGTNSKKRKLTSVVWNHFEKVNVNGEDKAECRYCKKKLGANSKNGTRHLHDHFKSCPRRTCRDIRQQVIGMGQKTTDGQTKISCLNFDPKKSRKDLAEMVPSRNTLKNDILKIYDFEKEKTMRLLEKNRSKIAITTDMWTSSNQKKGFMSITSHLIDDNWEMQSRIMRFIYVPCPHTAEVLADVLYESLLYKDVFKRLKQREAQYRSLPTDRDWELASSICGKLQLFYKVTLMFSGTKYPTANVFFPSICEIRIALSKWSEDRDEVIKAMGERMLVKFDKYWSVIHGVMGVAVVLDPRYKFKMMEYAFPKIYGFEKSDVEIVKLKVLVPRLFQDYETCNYESSQNRDVDSSRNTSDMEVQVEGGFFNDYFTFIEDDNHTGIMSELDHYLQEKVRTQNSELDILSWWKTNGFKYPTLQKIARDILAIPISTVASESAFSTSGRLQLVHKSPKHIVKASNMIVMMVTSNWGSQLFDDGGGVKPFIEWL
ncbi:hypothetical protein F3Y22_tig00111614pilonHSYRG00082 [Hibiscus syriacus]|uniref:BED-type domain-containing protein n=1 Tax=Hibiscus syriacus TaxID=106335 RepID=A0A6A2Y5K9_HIBSY|nr:hypothetical protein F3Y22_tig00111614pilonHSYRG00082 [Hibiscus syriacus]